MQLWLTFPSWLRTLSTFFEYIIFVYLLAILYFSIGREGPQRKPESQTAWKCYSFSSLQGVCLWPRKKSEHRPQRLSGAGIIKQKGKSLMADRGLLSGLPVKMLFQGFVLFLYKLRWVLIGWCVYMQIRWKLRTKNEWKGCSDWEGSVRTIICICAFDATKETEEMIRGYSLCPFPILWSQLGSSYAH